MKNQLLTIGIVLTRTDFGEADRIVTILTPDQGKLRAIAKGVRRPNSKLAGGIELFSVSNITFLPGKGDLGTIISTRLLVHYGDIVKDIKRTMLGYELLKRINRITEDAAGEEYFKILRTTLEGLNDLELPYDITELWFTMQILKVTGHTPNLRTEHAGGQLLAEKSYVFNFDAMAFKEQAEAPYNANHIKLLRLGYGTEAPGVFKQVTDISAFTPDALQLAKNILRLNVRV